MLKWKWMHFLIFLFYWVLYPFLLAQGLRFICAKINIDLLEKSSVIAERGMVATLTLLVFAIFNNNIQALIGNLSILPVTLLVVVCFFTTVYFVGLFISKKGWV